jgi:hypothetical protein
LTRVSPKSNGIRFGILGNTWYNQTALDLRVLLQILSPYLSEQELSDVLKVGRLPRQFVKLFIVRVGRSLYHYLRAVRVDLQALPQKARLLDRAAEEFHWRHKTDIWLEVFLLN